MSSTQKFLYAEEFPRVVFARDALSYYDQARQCLGVGLYSGERVVRFIGGHERFTEFLRRSHTLMGQIDPPQIREAALREKHALALKQGSYLAPIPEEEYRRIRLLEELPLRFANARPFIYRLQTWPTFTYSAERLARDSRTFFGYLQRADRELDGLAEAIDYFSLDI